MSQEHVCQLSQPWPTGHPLPPEDPARLQGPEVGEFMLYAPKSSVSRRIEGVLVKDPDPAPVVAQVIHRSYVWSPGECRHKGGYRHYDWSVIQEGPDRYRSVVVNDTDLYPLPEGKRVRTVYTLQRSVPAWIEGQE